MLKFKKRHSLFTLIEENSKVVQVVSYLIGQKQDNALPEEDNDTKLEKLFG